MVLIGGVALLAAVQVSLAQPAPAPPQLPRMPVTFRVGPQRPDLVRYNRVEALSLGVRGQARPATPFGPLSLTATLRLGAADRHLNGRLEVAHESLERRIVVSGYHELAAIDERARHFGVANSLMALLFGQDDGDYYRRSGATAEWTPPTFRPRSFRLRVFAEYQERVEKETDVQVPRLWDDTERFRPNIQADDGWDFGGSLELSRRFGTDPVRNRGGVETLVQVAKAEEAYVLSSIGADVALILPVRLRLSLEAAAGASHGSPPVQRLFYLGGPLTLRGYEPRTLGGEAFGRARAELDRAFSFGRLAVFTDVGWAGTRDDVDLDDSLGSAGVSLAIIDGILRIDGAWPLDRPHRFRLDVYLDQIL